MIEAPSGETERLRNVGQYSDGQEIPLIYDPDVLADNGTESELTHAEQMSEPSEALLEELGQAATAMRSSGRRSILFAVLQAPGQTLGELAGRSGIGVDEAGPSLSVLMDAGLVVSRLDKHNNVVYGLKGLDG